MTKTKKDSLETINIKIKMCYVCNCDIKEGDVVRIATEMTNKMPNVTNEPYNRGDLILGIAIEDGSHGQKIGVQTEGEALLHFDDYIPKSKPNEREPNEYQTVGMSTIPGKVFYMGFTDGKTNGYESKPKIIEYIGKGNSESCLVKVNL